MSEQDKNTPLSKDEQAEYRSLQGQFNEQFKKNRESLTPRQDYVFLKQEEEIVKNKEKACHDGAESAQKYLENIKYRFGGESPSDLTIKSVREIGCFIGEKLSAAGIRNEKAPEQIGEAVQQHLNENKMGTPTDAQDTLNKLLFNAPKKFDDFKCSSDYAKFMGWATQCPDTPAQPTGIPKNGNKQRTP